MSPREKTLEDEGYEAGKAGRGLSDCPYTDGDGVRWKTGLRRYLDAESEMGK